MNHYPDVLQDLTHTEEYLIAKSHPVGVVLTIIQAVTKYPEVQAKYAIRSPTGGVSSALWVFLMPSLKVG
ncbi:hypothetical protein N7501_007138 [Penicillium viridicatum]|nr:hypothetical protein N7501_007138 [Penicillium viridicatum]